MVTEVQPPAYKVHVDASNNWLAAVLAAASVNGTFSELNICTNSELDRERNKDASIDVIPCKTHIAQRSLSVSESSESSTYRELLAILFALHSWWFISKEKTVQIFTDSLNCTFITRKGSMKAKMNGLALEISELVSDLNMQLIISRKLNLQADF